MKPPRFAYHDPRSVPDALALLGKLENARLLAGGQSLMPMLNMRLAAPDHIIDLNKIEALSYLRVSFRIRPPAGSIKYAVSPLPATTPRAPLMVGTVAFR